MKINHALAAVAISDDNTKLYCRDILIHLSELVGHDDVVAALKKEDRLLRLERYKKIVSDLQKPPAQPKVEPAYVMPDERPAGEAFELKQLIGRRAVFNSTTGNGFPLPTDFKASGWQWAADKKDIEQLAPRERYLFELERSPQSMFSIREMTLLDARRYLEKVCL